MRRRPLRGVRTRPAPSTSTLSCSMRAAKDSTRPSLCGGPTTCSEIGIPFSPRPAGTATRLARYHGCRPSRSFRQANDRRLEAVECLRCTREQCGRRCRRSGRNRVTRRIDQRIDMILPDQQASGKSDRHQQQRKAKPQPEMDIEPDAPQASVYRSRHIRALWKHSNVDARRPRPRPTRR